MLPEEITIQFNPKSLLVSPVAPLLLFGLFFVPWGSPSAPAWVQAIGTVLALIGAAALPIYHSRHAELRRERTAAGQLRLLSEECYEKLWMLSNCFLNREREGHAIELFISAGRPEEWQVLELAVSQYPMELVPAKHLSALNTLRNSVSHARLICSQLRDWKEGGSNPGSVSLLRSRRDLLGITKDALPWPDGAAVLLDKFHQERGCAAELSSPPPGPVNRSGAKVYITWLGPKTQPHSAMVQIVWPYGEPEVTNFTYEGQEQMGWENRAAAEKTLWSKIDEVICEEYVDRSF
ncbi:hypothetical protein [Pseudomonas sp. XK-1]|uniref:hypothetical protein n=1 Tax=Pseudomonas sp. XK-1 TaxID=3136019 RepID=UPI003119AE79